MAAPLEGAQHLVGADAVREERPEDRARADPAEEVEVDDRAIREERLERAQHAELVEQALDAAAGEADRDLAAAARREQLAQRGLDRLAALGGHDAADAVVAERERALHAVGLHDREHALAKDRAAHPTVREHLVEERRGRGEPLAARVEQERVDRLMPEVAERALGLGDPEDPAAGGDRPLGGRVMDGAILGDARVGEALEAEVVEPGAEVEDGVHRRGP